MVYATQNPCYFSNKMSFVLCGIENNLWLPTLIYRHDMQCLIVLDGVSHILLVSCNCLRFCTYVALKSIFCCCQMINNDCLYASTHIKCAIDVQLKIRDGKNAVYSSNELHKIINLLKRNSNRVIRIYERFNTS